MILRNVTYGWQTNNNKVSTKLGRERLNGEIRERYGVGSGGNRTSQLQVRNLQIWAANTLSQLCTFAESETISFHHQPINTQGLTLSIISIMNQRVFTSRICWLLRNELRPMTQTVPPDPPPVILAPYKVPSSVVDLLCCIPCTNWTSLLVPSDPSPHAL